MKVYVVTRGSYSDYRIVGICSTEAAARSYVGARNDHDYEEHDLDDLDMPPKGMKSYRVVMDRDGNVPTHPYRYPPQPHIELNDDEPETEWRTWDGTDEVFFAEMWARDAGHAVKIANERRTVAFTNPTVTD